MPNRIIKDSINESDGLSNCSFFAVDLYKRLICYADDYGRFNADTIIMRARLYPRELEEISEEDIIDGLSELAGVGKIQFYTPQVFNQGGKKGVYGAFPNWKEHQRIRDSKNKCPEPDDTSVNDWYLRRFIPLEMKVQLLNRDNFKCQICGKYVTSCRDARRFVKLGSGLYHIDHIVPVVQGGRATMENLRVTCPECNLKRHKLFTFKDLLEETQNNTAESFSPQVAADCGELPPRARGRGIQSNPIQSESEDSTEPQAPSVLTLTLNDGSEYPITQENIDEWKTAFPNVDVVQQLHAMKLWCKDNPKKRKTKTGIRRFVTSWLDREQNRGGYKPNVPQQLSAAPSPPPDASTYRREPTEAEMRKLRKEMGYE